MTDKNEGLPQIELPLETTESSLPHPTEAVEPEVPSALRNVDPAKLNALKEKLRQFVAGPDKTASGSEAPSDAPAQPTQTSVASDQHIPTGKDVDWSEYDLDFSVRHLYPEALLRQTKEGVKWVVMLDEFYSTSRAGKQHGKQVNMPGTSDGKDTEPLNLGEYLTHEVNGPDGWKIAALLPGQMGEVVVVLQRKVPYILPDPKQLIKENENEVVAPTDEELARTEAAGIEFAAGVDMPVPALEGEDALTEGAQADGTSSVQFDADGKPVFTIEERLPEQLEGLAVRVNLELNPGEPAPAGAQPEDIEGIAAGVENIRRGLPNLLGGPDFGTV